MNRLTLEERYRCDPWFRTLVDFVEHHLDHPEVDNNFTPTELREAVTLAATMHERRRVRTRPEVHPW